MKIKFKKSNSIDFHNYYVFLNNKKYNLNQELNLNLIDNNNSFYVKTYWFKTKCHKIDLNHKECTVNIEFIISKKQYFILMSVFVILIMCCIIFDNYFMWTFTTFLSLVWLVFQFYIYTFGHKYYIKTVINYND